MTKNIFTRNLLNIPGWRTHRKLVIIESDDWGSIRMASKDVFNILLNKGYPVDQNPYNRFDALESNEDLEVLFETLSSVTDQFGNHAIITINNVVANPDFDRIKDSGYKQYHFETFDKTLNRYPAHDRVMSLYREGILKRIIRPQFHGREHLNISRWMRDLQTGNKTLLDAFEHRMYSLHAESNPTYKNEYLDSLDIDNLANIPVQIEMLKDGLKIFNNVWGYSSKSFIANCYVWNKEHESALQKFGVEYMQGIANQFIPIAENGYRYKRKFHYLGQKNEFGQYYLLRNAFFEPYQKPGFDWVNDCMGRIEMAFTWKKPAIISTHRVNFIGFLDKDFRDSNVKLFAELLKRIVKKWPEVEFISSDELGDLIKYKNN